MEMTILIKRSPSGFLENYLSLFAHPVAARRFADIATKRQVFENLIFRNLAFLKRIPVFFHCISIVAPWEIQPIFNRCQRFAAKKKLHNLQGKWLLHKQLARYCADSSWKQSSQLKIIFYSCSDFEIRFPKILRSSAFRSFCFAEIIA